MAQINPARLTRILSVLRNSKNERVEPFPEQVSTPTGNQAKIGRSTAVLRSRLKTRLHDSRDQQNFAETAPVMTIQEILCWEFGNQIMEHHDFEKITRQITSTILDEAHLARAMTALIKEISQED